MMKTIPFLLAAAAAYTAFGLAPSRTASDHIVVTAVPNSPALQDQSVTLLTPSATATLHDAPSGKQLAQISNGAALTVIGRDRGWVRVRVEGWVTDSQLVPADSALRMSPSAADVRADPAGMRGRAVRWEVEFISLQRADPLRRDLRPEEWYMLVRGPGNENAISYMVVPDNLRAAAEGLAPLTRIVVTARVRVGRSQPAGVPILDIESLIRR